MPNHTDQSQRRKTEARTVLREKRHRFGSKIIGIFAEKKKKIGLNVHLWNTLFPSS